VGVVSVVRAIATQADELLSDLDELRAAIASGKLPATTVLIVTRDRVSEVSGFHLCGESLAYSHLIGLLTQQAHDLCVQSREHR
jgi:iron uptake system EfeUOB component EfeO/EfeM